MEDCSSVASTPAPTDCHVKGTKMKTSLDGEKTKMKMKETVVSHDLALSPALSSSRGRIVRLPADDSVHRRPGLALDINKLPRPGFARTNKASNHSLKERMMNSGVYPCRFCSRQFLSSRAQVAHHTAHEKNRRALNPSSSRNYSPYSTISREAVYKSCSSLLRARLEFMNQKKPLKPWRRSLGFQANHSGWQALEQELAMKWRSSMSVDRRFKSLPSDHRNKWVHRRGFTGTPGFEQTDALSLELTLGRSNNNQTQTKGPTHSRFLNRQEASTDNIFIDHSGLDLTLRL